MEEIGELVRQFNMKHEVSLEDQTLVLAEEAGELAEAVLALRGKKLFKPEGSVDDVEAEAADVIYTAISVAIMAGVDPMDLREQVWDLASGNLDRGTEE